MKVGGNLTLGGALNAKVASAGYYRLFEYDGSLSGSFASTAATSTAPSFAVASHQVQTGIARQVNLSVLGAGQTMHFWDGGDTTGNGTVNGGTGTWTSAGTNWTGAPGRANINGSFGGSVGVFAGATGGTVNIVGTQSFDTLQFSSATSDNYHLGIYAGGRWGEASLRTGAAYSWHDIETNRTVSFPGVTDSLNADYSAGTGQVFGEFAYAFKAGSVDLEPFANLAYVHLNRDGFVERGGAAALFGKDASQDTTFTTLGLRAASSFDLGGVPATARGTVGWRHAFGDTLPLSLNGFSPASTFVIAGVPIAENTAVLEAGLDFAVAPEATLGLTYTGQFGGGVSDQSVKANLRVKF